MSKRVITFGQWDGKPIQWLVLKEDGFSMFCLSKEILFNGRFDSSRSSGNRWDKSEIRKYLNNEFWKTSFTDEEKANIVNHLIEGENFSDTKDNVFLMSVYEANNLLNERERARGSIYTLRSIHKDGSEYCSHVESNGVVYDRSSSRTYLDNYYGIRPAIIVKNKEKYI